MRKITGGVFMSLDGVVQAPGGPTEDYTGGLTKAAGCSDTMTTAFSRPSGNCSRVSSTCCSGGGPMTFSLHTGPMRRVMLHRWVRRSPLPANTC